MDKLVKKFTSYEDIIKQLPDYEGVLLKFGSPTCPPCVAVDRGPLEDLNNTVNKELSRIHKKPVLFLSCDVSKDNLVELVSETFITPPTSIPAFYILKNNNNQLKFCDSATGYNMEAPQDWIKKFTSLIINCLNK